MTAPGPVEPHLFVIFGATGDLTRRKLIPALYRLMTGDALNQRSHVLAVSRDRKLDDDRFRDMTKEALREAELSPQQVARWCTTCLHFQGIGEGKTEDYRALGERIASLEREHQLPGNRVFYLALPPAAFSAAIAGLGEAGLNRSAGWTRLVVEKPFGHDLDSARKLNQLIHRFFEEDQVYRIDHYLGKETVQNLLVFRFANPIFESLWNRDRVEQVEITVAEELGVEERAGYYEEAGALRDMVQNHLTQLLTLVAMEVPAAFAADAIRAEKIKVLQVVEPISLEDAVFGQYARGQIDGKAVPGYREEPDVAPDSATPTFVGLKLWIANWRWHGVPFHLRTGKRLPERLSRIVLAFRNPPVAFFRPHDSCEIHANALVITIQPDEGFDLLFEVKQPGQAVAIETESLHYRYAESFGALRDAYDTLLVDIAQGDQTLFVHADEVETSWRLYTPLLKRGISPQPYPAGTWGPGGAASPVVATSADRPVHEHRA